MIQLDESGRVQTTGWTDHNLVFSCTSGDNESPEITSGAFAETDHFNISLPSKSRMFPIVHGFAPSAEVAFSSL